MDCDSKFPNVQFMDKARKLVLARSKEAGDKLKEWSLAIGRNETYLQQWISKGSPKFLPELERHKLADILKMQEQELRSPSMPKIIPRSAIKKPRFDLSEYRLIGSYEQAAAAGHGAFLDDGIQVPKNYIAFRKDWLRSITGALDDDLFVLVADGSSMEPTIRDGDSVLVDKTQVNPRKDGIFVFVWDGLLNIKRLTSNPTAKTVSISSDNPAHRSYDGTNPEDIQVIGRVIWIGRRI